MLAYDRIFVPDVYLELKYVFRHTLMAGFVLCRICCLNLVKKRKIVAITPAFTNTDLINEKSSDKQNCNRVVEIGYFVHAGSNC